MYKIIYDDIFFNKRLSSDEKILYMYFGSFKVFFGTNKMLTEKFGFTLRKLKYLLKNMKENGYIKIENGGGKKRKIYVGCGVVSTPVCGVETTPVCGVVSTPVRNLHIINYKYNIININLPMDFLEFLKFFDNEKNTILLLEKSFDFFWKNYPVKIDKIKSEKIFFDLKFLDLENMKIEIYNIFLGLDKYCEKWKIENTQKKYIPTPANFLQNKKYYDEIIIDDEIKNNSISENRKKELIKQKKKEENEKKVKSQQFELAKNEMLTFYNKLSQIEKEEIEKEAYEYVNKKHSNLSILYKKPLILAKKHILIKEKMKKSQNFAI